MKNYKNLRGLNNKNNYQTEIDLSYYKYHYFNIHFKEIKYINIFIA